MSSSVTSGFMNTVLTTSLAGGDAGAGERLGPDDLRVARVGRKELTPGVLALGPQLLDTGSFHCLSSPGLVLSELG